MINELSDTFRSLPLMDGEGYIRLVRTEDDGSVKATVISEKIIR